VDARLPPVLHIDDEDPAGPHENHVDVRAAATRPLPVREDMPTGVVHAYQHAGDVLLAPSACRPVLVMTTQLFEQVLELQNLPLNTVDLLGELGCLGQGRRLR